MPRTEAANQRLREAQRAKILDTARMLFAQNGLAATMADIAAAAHISQGLAYHYFANKAALVNELLEQAVQSRGATLQRILEMPGSPGTRLDLLVSKSLENMRERLDFYQLTQQALHDEATPEHLRELLRHQAQTYQDVLRQLITEGQATGEVVSDDPDQLVLVITACLNGLARLGMRSPAEFQEHFPGAGIILRMLKP
jgi:AcrR family transcriptional regulator